MGAMKAPEPIECPVELSYLYDSYRQVKFSKIPNDDGFLLIPRSVLNYEALEAYSRVSELNLQHWEIETMICIDSIFERSRGG